MENTNFNTTDEGIAYALTGERDRGRVLPYHHKPSPRNLSCGAKNTDIANLKAPSKRNLIQMANGDFDSKFTIGMEVEKARLSSRAVNEYELFCGFERDSSCGYEAVTNILPLLPSGKWRNKIFSMMFDARRIIEDQYSPSSVKCGGHITVACDGMDGEELLSKMRGNCGILLALFRKRLENYYCKRNANLVSEEGSTPMLHEYHSRKFSVALVKENCVEFRLISRFQSVKQMMRRYELFYEIMNFSINSPNGSHNTLLKKLRPIISSMYSNDEEKVNEVIELSKHFRKFILTNKINRNVVDYLDVNRSLNASVWYDRDLLNNGYRAI